MKRGLLALVWRGRCLAALRAAHGAAGDCGARPRPAEPRQREDGEAQTAHEGAKPRRSPRRRSPVESASKSETTLVDAPATMSVVTAQTLATSPPQNYADLLRSVPGHERDPDLGPRPQPHHAARPPRRSTTRSSCSWTAARCTSTSSASCCGTSSRTPTSGDIKQIEVVRGPASVVWGANALTGVVNVITKSPREHEGFGVTLRCRPLQPRRAARATATATATSTTATSRTRARSTTRGRTS